MGFTPQLVDLDGDGRTDVLSGSWPGELYFFRRDTDGTFAKDEHLQYKDGMAINLGSASTVFATDWHSDGDLDLLVGNITGEVYLVPNESGNKSLEFADAERLVSLGDRELHDSHPVAADWDGDGLNDLLVGHSQGGVLWLRNEGTAKSPRLVEEPVELIPNSPSPWKDDAARRPDDWGVRAKICVVDWNHDGQLDILLGDYCGGYSSKPNRTPEDLEREREALRRLPELRKSWAAAFRRYRVLLANKSDDAESDHAGQLVKVRHEMVRLKDQISRCQSIQQDFEPQRQAHGFVWLFLRKSDNERQD